MSEQQTPKVDAIAETTHSAPPSADKPNKRQKVAIACDVCRAKKVKCDSVRPVCGPCSKRQHGAPCEYTTVTRTSHGPTKGYVHHLELKLRELQAGREMSMDELLKSRKDLMPLSKPEPTDTPPHRQSSSSFSQHSATNWGTPIQWQQRPPDDHPRQSSSAAPPPPLQRSPHLNGSATPDASNGRLLEGENGVNGRPSSFMHPARSPPTEHSTEHQVASRSPIMEHQPTDPAAPPTTTAAIRKRPRSVDYILPSRKTADGLLDTYWETSHSLFPVLDYEVFNAAYQSIWSGSPIENESQIMCTLNVIFALASSYTDSLDARSRAQSADVFFDRAQELLELDLWSGSGHSLETIQCLLLICQFLQSRSSSRQTWVFIGLAISMAESLFLHASPQLVVTERLKIVHQVVWHGCLYMKRILAMQSKLSPMIDKVSATMISRPFRLNSRPEEQHFFHSITLSEILDEILQQNYTYRSESQNEFNHESILTSVTKLDDQLSRWRKDLPQQLLQVSQPQAPRTPRNRQANSIRLQYYNARILLFRPILVNWCRLQVDPRDATYSESFQAQTSLTCSTLCLHSSLDMIEFIYTRFPGFETAAPVPAGPDGAVPSNPNFSTLPAWWDLVSYLHTSALILLASRLNRTLCLSVPGMTLEDAFNTAVYCIRQYARFGGPLAEKSARSLESLAARTERARMDIATDAQGNRIPDAPGSRAPEMGLNRMADLEPVIRGFEWVECGVYEL